MQSVQNLNKLR